MTQRELIDVCNVIGIENCFYGKCPYDNNECDAYFKKYGDVPVGDDEMNPERYTDEEIKVSIILDEHGFCDCDICAYCNISINEEPCSNCSQSNCKYEPIEKEGCAKRGDTK